MPVEARWDEIQAVSKEPKIAKRIDEARVLIDEELTRAGWHVCDRVDIDLVNQFGSAVRQVIMKPDHFDKAY